MTPNNQLRFFRPPFHWKTTCCFCYSKSNQSPLLQTKTALKTLFLAIFWIKIFCTEPEINWFFKEQLTTNTLYFVKIWIVTERCERSRGARTTSRSRFLSDRLNVWNLAPNISMRSFNHIFFGSYVVLHLATIPQNTFIFMLLFIIA